MRASTLAGQPVAVAAQRLRQQGLAVRIRWQRGGGEPPGTVVSVRPAGRRPVGSQVTLTAALAPPRPGPGPGPGRGHGPRPGPGPGPANGGGQGGDSQGGNGQGGGTKPHGSGHHGGSAVA